MTHDKKYFWPEIIEEKAHENKWKEYLHQLHSFTIAKPLTTIYRSLFIRQNINHKVLQRASNAGFYALRVIQLAKIRRRRRGENLRKCSGAAYFSILYVREFSFVYYFVSLFVFVFLFFFLPHCQTSTLFCWESGHYPLAMAIFKYPWTIFLLFRILRWFVLDNICHVNLEIPAT